MYGVPVPVVLPPPAMMAAMPMPWVAMGLPPPPPPPQAAPAPAHTEGSGSPDPVQALFEVLTDPGVDAAVCRRALRRLGPHAGRLLTLGGDSLLHYLAKAGRVDLVRLLVEPPTPGSGEAPAVDAAARADLLGWRNHEGHTALHAAIASEQEACALVLVHAGGPEARKAPTGTPEGVPPIVLAAMMGMPVVVRALLAYGIALDTRDARGWTCLHAAASAGSKNMVEWLVDERGADTHALDAQGWRPHDIAMKHGHSGVFALLHARLTRRVQPPAPSPAMVVAAAAVATSASFSVASGGGSEGGESAAEREERRRLKEREKRRRRKANARERLKALEGRVEGHEAARLRALARLADEEGEEDGQDEDEEEDGGVVGDRIVMRARALSQEAALLAGLEEEGEGDDEDAGHSPSSLSFSASAASASGSGSGSAATVQAAGGLGSFLVDDLLVADEAVRPGMAEGSPLLAESRLFGRWRPQAAAAQQEEEEEEGGWHSQESAGSAPSSPVRPHQRAPARVVLAGQEEGDEEEEASFEALLRARAPAEFLCPLSGSLMRKAVVGMDGIAYEQAALESYMEAAATGTTPLVSPSTGEPMAAVIVPHFSLRKLLDAWIEETRAEWAGMRR